MPCQTRGSVAEASEGPDASPAPDGDDSLGGDAVRGGGRRPRALLLAKHGVLQALGETELAHTLGRDLDRLAGLRIASHARLPVREDELAEARQHESVFGFLARQVQRLL